MLLPYRLNQDSRWIESKLFLLIFFPIIVLLLEKF